jgi:hypothetical protein
MNRCDKKSESELCLRLSLGTNGVVNFIWKGRCSENISLRTKRCVYFTPNGAHYVPDPKPVLQKPGNFSRLSSVGLKMADGQGEKKIFKLTLLFLAAGLRRETLGVAGHHSSQQREHHTTRAHCQNRSQTDTKKQG